MAMRDMDPQNDYATGIDDSEIGEVSIPSEVFHAEDGDVIFDFEIERFRGGDFVVHIIQGEQRVPTWQAERDGEGEGPRYVHAIYFGTPTTDLSEVTGWVEKTLGEDCATRADVEAALEEFIGDYGQRISLGRGSWIDGDNRIRHALARKAS